MSTSVKRWLHSLGINAHHISTISSRHTLLTDRFRNGTVLCDLAVILEKGETDKLGFEGGVRNEPVNAKEVRRNVCASLCVFLGRMSPPINMRLLVDPDGIIGGNGDLIDNLLFEIMSAYPRGAGFVGVRSGDWHGLWRRRSGCWLQYTPLERQRLEQCLVQWLIENGTLPSLGLHDRFIPLTDGPEGTVKDFYTITRNKITGRMTEFLTPSLLELEDVIRDGTLLCSLCSHLKGLSNQRVRLTDGWIRRPKTRRCKVNNLVKVLDAIKGWFNVGRGRRGGAGGGVAMSHR